MTAQLRIYFDTDTLLSLASAKPAMAAVTGWFDDRCHVTTRVLDEVKRKRQQAFPNSAVAYGAAMRMTPVEPSDLGVDVMDRMAYFRDRLAGGNDHPREHLGEASCVAVAVETGGLGAV